MSSNADEELERIKRELQGQPTPHIEKPPELEISDGSSCFLDKDRMCDATCRAFDIGVQPSQGPEVCTILGSLLDVGDAIQPLIGTAQVLRKKRQDEQREKAGTQPVPDPTGRKRTA